MLLIDDLATRDTMRGRYGVKRKRCEKRATLDFSGGGRRGPFGRVLSADERRTRSDERKREGGCTQRPISGRKVRSLGPGWTLSPARAL